jgi:hypothetical protein
MRTQSPDTHPEAERVQIALMRNFTPARKFALFCGFTSSLLAISSSQQSDQPKWIAVRYGAPWAKRWQTWHTRHPDIALQSPDLAAIITDICDRLVARHITFALAGLAACNIYGLNSLIQTVEIVVDYPRHIQLSPHHIRHGDAYLDAIRPFRIEILHDANLAKRARWLPFLDDTHCLPILPPEDIALSLLRHFAATGQRDDGLYNDLLGMLKVQAPALDVAYLRHHTENDLLLTQALDDAGVTP